MRGQSKHIKQIDQRVLKDGMCPSYNHRFIILIGIDTAQMCIIKTRLIKNRGWSWFEIYRKTRK